MTTAGTKPANAVAGIAAAALIVAGGALGAWRLGQDLWKLDGPALRTALAFDDGRRIELELKKREPLDGFPAGELRALAAAFEREVPGDAQVVVRSYPPARKRGSIARIGVLAFPVRFDELLELPVGGPDPDKLHPNVFFLDLEPLGVEAFAPWFELVAEASSWRLWRGKEQQQ